MSIDIDLYNLCLIAVNDEGIFSHKIVPFILFFLNIDQLLLIF